MVAQENLFVINIMCIMMFYECQKGFNHLVFPRFVSIYYEIFSALINIEHHIFFFSEKIEVDVKCV